MRSWERVSMCCIASGHHEILNLVLSTECYKLWVGCFCSWRAPSVWTTQIGRMSIHSECKLHPFCTFRFLSSPSLTNTTQFFIFAVNEYVFCFYLQLRYNPISSGFSTQQNIGFRFCRPTEPVTPTVSFSCNRRVDIITGLIEIHLNWTYEFIPLLEEAISVYNIFYNALIDGVASIGNNIPLDPQVNPLSVHAEVHKPHKH